MCLRAYIVVAEVFCGRQPELLTAAPQAAGFVAILQPFPEALEPMRAAMLDADAYVAHLGQARASAVVSEAPSEAVAVAAA